jgi:2,3-bisphosphoglycerate-dependent phosphoglycerate mutase
MSGQLILVRHSESTDNAKGVWSGIRNVGLTDKGRDDAFKYGDVLRDKTFDLIYISPLKRTRQTLTWLLKGYGRPTKAKIRKTAAINERDYGKLAGRDKWQVRARLGLAAWTDIRRGWDVPVPDGETLKDVYERVVPWYKEIVLPQLLKDKNVLIVAHGNSNRALRKFLENITNEAVRFVEMDFDKVRIYDIRDSGRAKRVLIRQIKTKKTHRY